MKEKLSSKDIRYLNIIRKDVSEFLHKCGEKYDKIGLLLDIAPQDHEGARPYFKRIDIETLDIDQNSGATYIADLCNKNDNIIPDNYFDFIVCTEVLEHTLNPFNAVDEMYRMLKKGGLVFVTVPFDLRIHGPFPDCWRLTEHRLRVLFGSFTVILLNQIESKNRWLMPVHYTLIAKKA